MSLAFKTAPDYETPGDDNADNEYQVRVVNTHDIHHLNNEGSPTGCSGSVLDVTIRVKDVGAPAPPEDLEAGFQDTDDTKIDVNWTASEGFSENGSLVAFPTGFEVTDYDYRYRPAGAAALDRRDRHRSDSDNSHARRFDGRCLRNSGAGQQ